MWFDRAAPARIPGARFEGKTSLVDYWEVGWLVTATEGKRKCVVDDFFYHKACEDLSIIE